MDKYDSQIFENSNINMGIIYRNYNAKKREKELGVIKEKLKTLDLLTNQKKFRVP